MLHNLNHWVSFLGGFTRTCLLAEAAGEFVEKYLMGDPVVANITFASATPAVGIMRYFWAWFFLSRFSLHPWDISCFSLKGWWFPSLISINTAFSTHYLSSYSNSFFHVSTIFDDGFLTAQIREIGGEREK